MKGRVLLIDDSKGIQDSFSSLLEFKGYNVVTANDGFEGIKKLAENEIDCIVLDIMMPVAGGFDFLENIKPNAQYSKIPVIVVSGTGEDGAREKALSLGAAEFFHKPVPPKEIIDTIDLYIQ